MMAVKSKCQPKHYISTAPRKKKGAFTAMATAGQRRAYWAKVRSGEAGHRDGVGYLRTNTMTRGWKYIVRNTSNGVKAEIGNKKAGLYGVYVQGKKQQPFHKASGWRTIDDTIDKTAPKIQKIFDDVVKKELNK